MDNLDYLMRGTLAGDGSSLASPYLDHPAIRDWIAMHFLRGNGPERPVYSDTASLIPALAEIRDLPGIEALIEHEKTINPRFAAWVDEAYISPLTKADFAGFAPDTVGGIYARYLLEHGFELNLARDMIQPRNDFEFLRFRFGQIHDYDHIIAGGGFDTVGEIMPYFVRLSSMHRHLSPALAAAFTDVHVLGGFRLLVRGGLNYPGAFLTMLDCLQRAIRIGIASEPIFMARFEDVLDLTPAQARVRLGVRHAEDSDTRAASAIFDNLD